MWHNSKLIFIFIYICDMSTKTQKTPKKAGKKNRVHHTMRIKPQILERIKVRADEEGRPVNNLIERILDLNV